eukprot:TRINITY_DN80147_c0_g1_i1.p1 TRINITY_DN80147_c0_g1~~TRINITY_DN80147_c0_g1_i1.p1  ORF type:complete len:407 (+),score=60.37 TRINITY_DN80147_c0_g1_i1:79-1221(+)
MTLRVLDDPTLSRTELLSESRGGYDGSHGVANTLLFSAWRAESLADELSLRQQQQAEQKRKEWVVLTIQRVVRGWLQRRKYLRHKQHLQRMLARIKLATETAAVRRIQRQARGFLARRKLRKLRAQAAKRAQEEEAKKKKKRPAPGPWRKEASRPASAAGEEENPVLRELEQFLKGLEAYWAFKYDDAIACFERHLKKVETVDKVSERLLERCKAGKADQLAQAKAQKQRKPQNTRPAPARKSTKKDDEPTDKNPSITKNNSTPNAAVIAETAADRPSQEQKETRAPRRVSSQNAQKTKSPDEVNPKPRPKPKSKLPATEVPRLRSSEGPADMNLLPPTGPPKADESTPFVFRSNTPTLPELLTRDDIKRRSASVTGSKP